MKLRRRRGASLVEALVALGLASAVLAGAAAMTARAWRRTRAPAAARAVASELRHLRSEGVARSRSVGLLFSQDATGTWCAVEVEDGDGDGLTLDDLRRGVDPKRGVARRVADMFGVAAGFAPAARGLRSPPPDDEPIRDLADPVHFGSRDLVSCTPRGTMTSGTLYLTDGRERQMAVVVYGVTARIRVWEYDLGRRRWIQR